MKTAKTKKKTSRRLTATERMNEQLKKLQSLADYPNAIEDVSDETVKKNIFPDVRIPVGGGKAMKITDHAATGTINFSQCEYNGPIPFGYREHVPHDVPLTGVAGKFFKHFAARNFYLGDQINAWFMQNCFIYKACSMPGDDAVAAGYEIVPRGTKDKRLIEELSFKFNSEEFNLDETMRKFECYKRAFGGALMIPCFAEDVDMSAPLVDYTQLKGKTFIGWSIIEPYYLAPIIESGSRELNDPTYKFYMCPTHWDIYGTAGGGKPMKHIHRSWCFFRRNIFTSKIYQPMYKYFGPSVPQAVIERLYSAEVCANESSMLLRSKRQFVLEADVRKLAANPAYAEKFFKNMSANRDNWGPCVVPRNSNAKQMDTYLTECMQLTTAQYGILCAEIGIPAPKFMMAQLTGFANSGNYEIKVYAANVIQMIKSDLMPIVNMTAKIEAATRGKDMDFTCKFGDIDIPTVVEQADIAYNLARQQKFEAEAKAITKGVKAANNHHTVTENPNPENQPS